MGQELAKRWPWKDLVEAIERADEAKQRKHHAEITSDRNAREKAILDEWEAMGDCEATRREWADLVLGGLRLLIRHGRGDQVAQLLSEALGVADLAERLSECELALMEVRDRLRGKAVQR